MELLGARGKYTALNYIESTGTQYINTDITIPPVYKVETGGVILANTTVYPDLYACEIADTYWCGIPLIESNKLTFWLGTASRLITIPSVSYPATFNMVAETSSSGMHVTYNGTTYSGNATFTGVNHALYIFANNRSSREVASYSKWKCAYFKLYTNSNLVRDYVPCALTEAVTDYWGNPQNAGAIGLWDRVSDKFFPNNGTGVFVAGNPI